MIFLIRLLLNSLHSSVNVFIDGNLIYTLKPLKNSFIKTTGTTWNYVLLHDNYRGKPLKIEISSVYGMKLNDSNIYFVSRLPLQGISLNQISLFLQLPQ